MNPFNIKNGGPAFPISIPGCGDNGAGGMTLRDYFAARVMERMISLCQEKDGGWSDQTVAHNCYLMADAMIEARRLSCHPEHEAECNQPYHVDDGVPYCDTCGVFRQSKVSK